MSGAAFADGHGADGAWSFEAGAIFLHRTTRNEGALFLGNGLTLGGTEIVGADDLSGLNSFGGVFSAYGPIADFNVEFRGIFTGLSNGDFAGDLPPQAGSSGISFASFDPLGNGLFGPVTTLDLTAERKTSFHSVEANADLYNTDNGRVFAGVRGLYIGDELNLLMDATPSGFPGTTNSTSVDVINRMAGIQIGAEYTFQPEAIENVSFVGSARVGLFRNWIDADTFSESVGIALPPGGSSDFDSRTSALIELGLEGVYAISDKIDFSLGYNLIYVSKVGSSVNTLNGSTTNTSNVLQTTIDDTNALYHGVTAKFTMRF